MALIGNRVKTTAKDKKHRRSRNYQRGSFTEDTTGFMISQSIKRRENNRMSKKPSKKKKKHGKFNGWDWIEIVDYFKVQHFGHEEEEDILKRFTDYIWSFWTWQTEEGNLGGRYEFPKAVVQPCRDFVWAVAQESHNHNHCGPLWDGLHSIESDETFMKYFCELLGHLWT